MDDDRREKTGNSNYKKIIYCFFVFLFVAILSLSGYSLAKYFNSKADENDSFVSLFVIQADYQESETIELETIRPGDSFDITLKVTNFNGNQISEVNLKYSFVVVTEHNLPLDITIVAEESDSSYASLSYGLTWENGEMMALVKTTHQFNINVCWDENNNDIKYADEIDILKITMYAEQMV